MKRLRWPSLLKRVASQTRHGARAYGLATTCIGFCVDAPVVGIIIDSDVVRVAGWFLDSKGQPADKISICLNGQPVATTSRVRRLDVAKAYPSAARAAMAGFLGDFLFPESADSVVLNCVAESGGLYFKSKEITVKKREIKAVGFSPRETTYNLSELLDDSIVNTSLSAVNLEPCVVIKGVRHVHARGHLPLIRLSELGPTHSYPDKTLNLIKSLNTNQKFLDLGCGIRPVKDILPNGVYLDAVHFRGVDIVSTIEDLPFKNESFDLVISHAVFEHLISPASMVSSLRRILKPGGEIYVDTAFMQPFHGDPDHYFNMTLNGLRSLFDGWDIIEAGVAPWQAPSFGLMMQLDAVVDFLPKGPWRNLLLEFRGKLASSGSELDASLGEIGREMLAAGVFLRATRR